MGCLERYALFTDRVWSYLVCPERYALVTDRVWSYMVCPERYALINLLSMVIYGLIFIFVGPAVV